MQVNKEIAGKQLLSFAGDQSSVAHPVLSALNESSPLSLLRARIRGVTFSTQYFALKAPVKMTSGWISRCGAGLFEVISRGHPTRLSIISVRNILFLVALTTVQQFAHATTYYIDSERGNDFWTGKLPAGASTASTEGPWQTLNRLATAPLLPGDNVYLACGSTWNETLRITSSGTNGAPIVISAGPNTCETPPAIEGAVAIPSHMWSAIQRRHLSRTAANRVHQ